MSMLTILTLLLSFSHQPLETCTISWYGGYFHGRLTACGETYDMNELSCAHKTLPMGSIVYFYNVERGKSIKLIVNDRGPYVVGRDFDFSRAAFDSLFGDIDIGVIGDIPYLVVGREIRPTMLYNL